MKKLIIACGVVAMSVFATSCKKDYTCSCTYTDVMGNEQSPEVPIENAKKSDAEDTCNEAEDGYNAVGTDASCSLD